MDPVVVRALQPYIVTSWHGHRDDPDLPDAVRTVWREKFAAGRNPRPRGPQNLGQRQSNVDLAFLDPSGNVVHWFDGFQHPGRGPQTLAEYTRRQVQTAAKRLNLPNNFPATRSVELPDLEGAAGVRVLCMLHDNRMRAYRAPTVEVIPLAENDWELLAYSDQERTVDASALKSWLSQVYPPGMMERTNPRTKEAYRIKSVEGKLTLTPADTRGKHRLMMVRGTIRLTDEGEDHFSYDGNLEILLAYKKGSRDFYALRGVFDGIYPRFDRMHNHLRNIPLQAVFESINTES